jgi:hypothetical protein
MEPLLRHVLVHPVGHLGGGGQGDAFVKNTRQSGGLPRLAGVSNNGSNEEILLGVQGYGKCLVDVDIIKRILFHRIQIRI